MTPHTAVSSLGTFLRDRRAHLIAADFGFTGERRRTPGLRREEVAQRANISPTWYTWLEQGRGGAPSADVLDRIAKALLLTEPERQHMFMLALGRLPEPRYAAPTSVPPRLQRVLDALLPCPALIRTPLWDVLAWNAAASALLFDYAQLQPEARNILRLMFTGPRTHKRQGNWNSLARYVVSVFRADAVRAGAGAEEAASKLAADISEQSAEFAALWQESNVAMQFDGNKQIHHPQAGQIEVEFTSFVTEGRQDLRMVVFHPTTPESAEKIRTLLAPRQNELQKSK